MESNFGMAKLGSVDWGLSKLGRVSGAEVDGIANPPKEAGAGAEGVSFGPSIFRRSFLLKSVMNEKEAYFCLSPSIESLNLEYWD